MPISGKPTEHRTPGSQSTCSLIKLILQSRGLICPGLEFIDLTREVSDNRRLLVQL